VYDTVVIGLGSPLMGDDGLGIVALNRVCEGWSFEPHVEFVDGGTWGMNLLHLIEGAKHVLFIDAINDSASPGEVVVVERERLPKFLATKLSPHQIDLKEVLALAELRGTLPEHTVAIGQQPARVEMSTELSAVVLNKLDALCERVVGRLDEWGHTAQRAVGVDA
jgi:hydrogenase maturation protease